MNIIKLSSIIIILIYFNSLLYAQNTKIPDKNFELALINLGYDKGEPDGVIPTENIKNIDELYLYGLNIKDLKGIEDFTALNWLNCGNNPLENIDVSKNVNLMNLFCDSTSLKELDVSKNIYLNILSCEKNQLRNIDLSKNINLYILYIEYNRLNSLDVTQNINLIKLFCENNFIKELDVSNIPELVALYYDSTVTVRKHILENKEYIIKLNNDTVFCNIIKQNYNVVVCDIDGRKIKYKPKKILGFKKGKKHYESGRGRTMAIGWRKWQFYNRIISGKLNLYENITVDHFISNSPSNSYSRSTGYGTSNTTGVVSSHYYVRLKNTPRGKLFKMSGVYWKGQLKKFVSNCPEVMDELKNNTTYWSQGWNKITMMYNSRCSD